MGHIFALTSITATTGATVQGQLLARDGAVTLDTNTVTNRPCTSSTLKTTVTGATNKKWYNHSLTITLSASDTQSSVASITYAVNGATPVVVAAATAKVPITVNMPRTQMTAPT